MDRRLIRIIVTEELQEAYEDLMYASKKNNENDLQRKLAIFLDRAQKNEGVAGDYLQELREIYLKRDKKEMLKVACKFGGDPCKRDIVYHHDWIAYLAALRDTEILDEEVYTEAMKRLDKIFEYPIEGEDNDT